MTRSQNSAKRKYYRNRLTLKVSPEVAEAAQDWLLVWSPPPKLTVSEWADAERQLSPESSAEPGQWRTSRAEYQRGMMDAVSDPNIERIVVMASSQTGKTDGLILNTIGYHIKSDPAPFLVVLPTLELADSFSEDRLAPMIRDTPSLQEKVAPVKSRTSGNKKRHKTFEGGHITLAGANSPASLASRPVRIVLADEVDRFPASAGREGDPVKLAEKRTTTFWNRKIIETSTPTIKGVSRIAHSWEMSDQCRFWVPCPCCGEMQTLKWRNVKWKDGDPETARYHCEISDCDAEWNDAQRWAAVSKGEWRAEKPLSKIKGFHIWEAYSPWVRMSKIVSQFLEAQGDPELLQVFVNTVLGELWEQKGEVVESHELSARAQKMGWTNGQDGSRTAPNDVLLVTCGCDVQIDRIEVERVGWGMREESWSLEHHIIYGDLSTAIPWQELDDYLNTPTYREDGTELPVTSAAIDSGGHHTDDVCQFAGARLRRRIYAIKGMANPRPVWPKRASKNRKSGAPVFIVGVDSAKDSIYGRLKLQNPGPGFCHFPADRDTEWFEQLTSEIVVTEKEKGFPKRVWQLKPNTRNEALDCRVYAFAALRSMNISWGKVNRMLHQRALAEHPKEKKQDKSVQQVAIPQTPPPQRQVVKSSFLTR